MSRYAFIGLGTMGYPMAGHLAKAGHDVRVFNRTHAKAAQWLAHHQSEAQGVLTQCDSAADAAREAEYIVLCVGNDAHVREQIQHPSHGIVAHLAPGSVIIDHTTTSATLAQEMAACVQPFGASFVDAPVSGGQQGAEQGTLVAMLGCQAEDSEHICHAIAPYTRHATRIGEVGAGQKAKMVNQICVAGVLQGLSEALFLSETLQLDSQAVLATIQGGAGGSWQMSHRGQSMLEKEYEHGFAVDWMIKDLGICLEQATQSGIELPSTERIKSYYDQLHAMGAGQWDTSALLHRLQQLKPS